MRRRVLHLLAAVSLALFLLVATAWPRSYWVSDVIEKLTAQADGDVGEMRRWGLESNRGSLQFAFHWRCSRGIETYDPSPLNWIADQPHGDLDNLMIPDSSFSYRGPDGWTTGSGWSVGEHGFGTMSGKYTEGDRFLSTQDHVLRLPHGLLLLLLALLPAISFRHLYQNRLSPRRRRAGLCPACGYDLRATPERCPECGTEASSGDRKKT